MWRVLQRAWGKSLEGPETWAGDLGRSAGITAALCLELRACFGVKDRRAQTGGTRLEHGQTISGSPGGQERTIGQVLFRVSLSHKLRQRQQRHVAITACLGLGRTG